MKVTLESTTRIVTLVVKDAGGLGETAFPCRVWEGVTERGVKVQALIPRIAAHKDEDLSQFEAELKEQAVPSAEVCAFPLRMIL